MVWKSAIIGVIYDIMRRITTLIAKYWHIPVAIAAIVFFVFFAWERIDPKLEMQTGNYYFNGGAYDLEKAEEAFKRALQAEPKILWGHYQLARVYFVKGKKDKALEEINKELEANPANLRSLYVRGLIYGYMPDLPRAEADFERFVRWAPKEWAGYNDLAWILAKEGKYSDAEKAAEEGIKEAIGGGQNAWLWNSLGVAQLNLKKYNDAEKSFRKALELARNMTENEWARAYPGNNPKGSSGGLRSFKAAVEANLSKAVDKASL